jgi:hypothetical protein
MTLSLHIARRSPIGFPVADPPVVLEAPSVGEGVRVSRWSDIILARRSGASPDGEGGVPWGPWHPVPSTAGIQVRVRRECVSGSGNRELYAWAYEFKSQLPRPIGFQYKIQMTKDGPFDRLVRQLLPGEVVRGSVILSTSGPVWIDATLIE